MLIIIDNYPSRRRHMLHIFRVEKSICSLARPISLLTTFSSQKFHENKNENSKGLQTVIQLDHYLILNYVRGDFIINKRPPTLAVTSESV